MAPQADDLTIRLLAEADLVHLADLDRSEEITLGYRVEEGRLIAEPVDRKRSRWDEGQVARFRLRVLEQLERGGQAVGAFDGDRLVGFAVLGYCFRGPNRDYLHLDLLHVSRPYRRMGVATRLMEQIESLARERGARRLYISATPSQSAVGFYFSRGARLAPEPDPELHALEPHDIPLMIEL
ncbi:MAG: GNAT family N-acetyltransferase [Anaerolineae bacterium]|jgi:GNAT superfamily N-acetyltransferase